MTCITEVLAALNYISDKACCEKNQASKVPYSPVGDWRWVALGYWCESCCRDRASWVSRCDRARGLGPLERTFLLAGRQALVSFCPEDLPRELQAASVSDKTVAPSLDLLGDEAKMPFGAAGHSAVAQKNPVQLCRFHGVVASQLTACLLPRARPFQASALMLVDETLRFPRSSCLP